MTKDIENVKNNGRLMMKSICPICGNKKSRIISQWSGLLDSLRVNTPQNRMKMHFGMLLDNKL